MSSNSENTEARLAAYIDGQLDPADRAQLEQYLAANPESRKVLAELIAQREQLRNLPRSKAPADVYDSIQAQLERAILLDETGLAAPAAARHSWRPQLFGIAAILLLAIGLGVVLYFALPTSRPSAVEVAVNKPAPTTADSDTASDFAGTRLATADTMRRAESPMAKSSSALAEAPAAAPAAPGVASNAVAANPVREALADNRIHAKAAMGKGGFGQGGPALVNQAGQVVLLVSTDNPSRAERQVHSYLEANGIRWETLDTPASAYFDRTDVARTQTAQIFQKKLGVEQKAESVAAPSDRAAIAGRKLQVAQAPQSTDPSQQVEQVSPVAQLPEGQQLKQPGPIGGVLTGQQMVNAEGSVGAAQSRLRQISQQQSRNLILARGMTRRQAAQLSSSLSADRLSQSAQLLDESAHLNFSFAEDKAKESIAPDAGISVAAPAAPSAEIAPNVAPSETTAPVDSLPQQQVLAQQAPAGQSLTQQQAFGSPSTQPLSVDLGSAAAAAQPAPTTEPFAASDEPLDVVILVQSDAAATEPATQPALQAAPNLTPSTAP